MLDINNFWPALFLTILAGLSTGIGSIIACFIKRTNTQVLSIALGFSAGVMIYVSFMEILKEANVEMTIFFGENKGAWATALVFFGGIAIV